MRQDKTGADRLKPDETAPDRPRTAEAGESAPDRPRPVKTEPKTGFDWLKQDQTGSNRY